MIEIPWYPTQKQLRQFVWISPVGFALIGFSVWRATGSSTAWIVLAAIGVALFLAGLARPGVVRPIYLLAMAIAFPIGWLVSNLAFLAIYYLVLTPLALVFRLIGRDALLLRRTTAQTFWRERSGPPTPESYWRQG